MKCDMHQVLTLIVLVEWEGTEDKKDINGMEK